MNIINTLLATFGPLYRSLNGIALPSLSSTINFSTRAKSSCVGISLFVFTSPLNSSVLSTSPAWFCSDALGASTDDVSRDSDVLRGAIPISLSIPFDLGVSLDVDVTAASRAAGESEEITMFANLALFALLEAQLSSAQASVFCS